MVYSVTALSAKQEEFLITGLEAAAILRKKYPSINMRTIDAALFSLRASIDFRADHSENKDPIVTKSVLGNYEAFEYPKNDVLNLIIEPIDHYINLNTLSERKLWKDFYKQEILNFITAKTPELMVFGISHECYRFYTEKAQDWIANEQALFCLEDIITIEEEHFPDDQNETGSESFSKKIIEGIFNGEIQKIKAGNAEFPHNKNVMVGRILRTGVQHNLFADKKLSDDTITRYISEICKKRGVPYNQLMNGLRSLTAKL